ncbi:MAG: SPOR domain-containing protein [Crocinitomicaceae bacterium]|nr:SPOR domain-containing protein [Crocinitomicaceae bacterium]
MTSIEQLIGDLLLRHNCVVVPTFGGFVAKQVSAKVDYDKGIINPPKKSLLFNAQLINNDGLLINELSQANGITFDEASIEVANKISDWSESLKSGGRIELDRVGNLFFDAENNICFEQDRFFNLLLESFGLGQVHFIAEEDVQLVRAEVIRREVAVEVQEEEKVEEKPIIEITQSMDPKIISMVSENEEVTPSLNKETVEVLEPRKRRRILPYIAAAGLAFYAVWIPAKTDVLESGVISFHDFNPFHTHSEGNYVKEQFSENISFEAEDIETLDEQIGDATDLDFFRYNFTEGASILLDLREEKIEDKDLVEEVSRVTETSSEKEEFQPNSRHVIVGCFGSELNAKNLVEKLNSLGMDAQIVDFHNGLHRVSAGAGISDESISQIRSKAEGFGFPGWVLK